MIDFRQLLSAFVAQHAEVVVIGGLALTLRGGSRATYDLDLCYARSAENLPRVAAALAPLQPRLRGADPSLPFFWDVATLRSGCNFTLVTTAGDVDLLGEVTGLGGYAAVLQRSSPMPLFGLEVPVLDLDGLERAKAAAGRAKDLIDLAEIASLRSRRS
ncbi:MAG TPA: hypothetical protein VM734_31770 [Kofleriaceae bacterium]|jgi:hypothetical protein|nr:hypothetical protein [Kofleriaceae bacterium]